MDFKMDGAVERMQNPKELPAATTKVLTMALSHNKAALPAAIAVDTYRVAKAVVRDYQTGAAMPRRTITTGASVVGGWGGAIGGMMSGAALGSMFIPVVGSFVGGLVGGIAGGVGGSVVAKNVTVNYMEFTEEESDSDED